MGLVLSVWLLGQWVPGLPCVQPVLPLLLLAPDCASQCAYLLILNKTVCKRESGQYHKDEHI